MPRSAVMNPLSRRSFVPGAAAVGIGTTVAAARSSGNTGSTTKAAGKPVKGGPKTTPNTDVIYPVGSVAWHKGPVTTERATRTVVVPQDVQVGDWSTHTQWLEKRTNVRLIYKEVAADGANGTNDVIAKINATTSSGDLLDVFPSSYYNGFTNSQLQHYGHDQQLLRPLNEPIDKYCVETTRTVKNPPEVKKVYPLPDGKIYSLPNISTARGYYWAAFLDILKSGKHPKYLRDVCIPTLKGPNGFRTAGSDCYMPYSLGNYVITKARTIIAATWDDAQFERESIMRSYQGIPGKNWRWARKGEIGINGKQAIYNRLEIWPPRPGIAWIQNEIMYRLDGFRLGEAVDPAHPAFEKAPYENTRTPYYLYRQPESRQLPPLTMTSDEAGQIADLQVAINNYATHMMAKFIQSKPDLGGDTAWNSNVSTRNQMNPPNTPRSTGRGTRVGRDKSDRLLTWVDPISYSLAVTVARQAAVIGKAAVSVATEVAETVHQRSP